MRISGRAIAAIRAALSGSTGRKSIIDPTRRADLPFGSSSITVDRQS